MKIKLVTAVLCAMISMVSVSVMAGIGPPAAMQGGVAESSDSEKSQGNVAVDDGGNLQLVPESELSQKPEWPPVFPPPGTPQAPMNPPADSTSVPVPGSPEQSGIGAPSSQMPQDMSSGQMPQGMPSSQMPQGMPSGQMPQGMPSGQMPQGMPSGQMPQGQQQSGY